MSEKFDKENFVSREKDFLIDRESGYFSALEFSRNPVNYLEAYRDELIKDGFASEDRCQQTTAMICELEDIISNEDIAVKDERVRQMINAEYNSESWIRITFGLLKAAGYSKEEALAWVILDDDRYTPEDLLKERTQRYFIQQVYDNT